MLFGCSAGTVSALVYTVDTQAFFDTYYDEIESLRKEYECETGTVMRIETDLKNNLAWFAYEYTANKLLTEIKRL